MFKASDQEAAKSAASLTKASQALVPLDVSQGSHGLDRPVSVSSKNIFEDKVSTPQTELPAVIKNAFRHSPQPKCYRINLSGSHILSPEDFKETDLKDVNPGKRPVLQLELSPAVKQRGGVKMALQRPAMEVHIDNMAPKSVGDADGTEMRAKASISILKSPSGTGKNAGVEWKDLELLPERIVEQDIEIFYTCPDESRNIDTTFAENTHCSPASTDVTATAKASIHFVGGIVAPENQVFHQAHVLRGRKGQCCSSTSPDKTCQPHITTLIPSHETESGFEPVTAIKLPRGRSHHSIASPPDRDILELGTQQCTNGQKSVNDTAKHKQRPKRQRKYIVRASGSPVRTEDVAVEAERSVGEAQLLQVNPTVLRFPSPGPEIRLTYPSMLSQSISSYAPAKSTVEAMMQASNLTDTDDPFISTPDKEISILRRNLDEFTKVDQQSVSTHEVPASDYIRVCCRKMGVVGLTFIRMMWMLPIPSLLRAHPLHITLKLHLPRRLRITTIL